MRFSAICLSLNMVYVALLVSMPAIAQDKFDRKVVCFQQYRVDSILRFVKKKKDVSLFFQEGSLKNAQLFQSQVDLMRMGLIKHKKMTVERTVQVWSGMLPQYEERYYFEMKDDRVVVVFIGFTAVSKFAGWEKVLNLTVKHWTKEQIKEYKESEGILMSEEDWIKTETVNYVKVDKDICK